MLISHSNHFITIDVPKTGTRSIRTSLKSIGVLDIVGEPTPTEDNPFEQHGSASSARQVFTENGWVWRNYYKWTIARNPWERYFSFFKYFKSYGEKYLSRDPSIHWGLPEINQGKYCYNLFLKSSYQTILKNIILNNNSQSSYYFDENGELIVDYIADFENFSNEFHILCKKVEIQTPKLAHENKSINCFNINDIYNQELIDLVADKEEVIIKLKGYKY